MYAAVLVCFVVLTARLWYVQIYQGTYYRSQAEHNRIRTDRVAPLRGIIYDRRGVQLVTNAPSFAITMVYADVPRADRQGVLAHLAATLGIEVTDFQHELELAKNDAYTPVVLVSNVRRELALSVLEKSADLPGIAVKTEPQRLYPHAPILAHVLGYVGRIDAATYRAAKDTAQPYQLDDYVGQAGLERQCEDDLRGVPGSRQVEVDVGGRIIKEVSVKPARAGKSIALTIETDLEQAVVRALERGLTASHATTGAVVVLDARNGEVLAAATVPSYDNNLFVGGISSTEWQRLVADPDRPLLDRTTGSPMAPGGLTAPWLMAAALQEHRATVDTLLDCSPRVETGGVIIRSGRTTQPHAVRLGNIMTDGCESLLVRLADNLQGGPTPSPEQLLKYAQAFGFGERTGLDIGGESAGNVPSPTWKTMVYGQPWDTLDSYDLALGRGSMQVTPLQVAVMMAAIGNGGVRVQPHYVLDIVESPATGDKVTIDTSRIHQPEGGKHVPIDVNTLAAVQESLRGATMSGEGAGMRDMNPPVAGIVASADTSGSRLVVDPSYTSWWAGYAPAHNPDIAVVVVVPGGGTGSETALPVAREIISSYFAQRSGGTSTDER